jgi:hypothetical protein
MNVKDMSLPMPKNGKPMTNEEWLKQCNTEQLAEWICSVREKCYYCGAKQIPDREHCAFGDEFCRINRHEFVMWLKQPHKPIS